MALSACACTVVMERCHSIIIQHYCVTKILYYHVSTTVKVCRMVVLLTTLKVEGATARM